MPGCLGGVSPNSCVSEVKNFFPLADSSWKGSVMDLSFFFFFFFRGLQSKAVGSAQKKRVIEAVVVTTTWILGSVLSNYWNDCISLSSKSLSNVGNVFIWQQNAREVIDNYFGKISELCSYCFHAVLGNCLLC